MAVLLKNASAGETHSPGDHAHPAVGRPAAGGVRENAKSPGAREHSPEKAAGPRQHSGTAGLPHPPEATSGEERLTSAAAAPPGRRPAAKLEAPSAARHGQRRAAGGSDGTVPALRSESDAGDAALPPPPPAGAGEDRFSEPPPNYAAAAGGSPVERQAVRRPAQPSAAGEGYSPELPLVRIAVASAPEPSPLARRAPQQPFLDGSPRRIFAEVQMTSSPSPRHRPLGGVLRSGEKSLLDAGSECVSPSLRLHEQAENLHSQLRTFSRLLSTPIQCSPVGQSPKAGAGAGAEFEAARPANLRFQMRMAAAAQDLDGQ